LDHTSDTFGRSGALGAGLAIFSRFPIVAATIHPYSLNGSPIDVLAGDWFVGKAAASVLVTHPTLGQVQVFNTHVSAQDIML
jgi:sphingomyelin phosphodiesterase 2